MLSEKAKHKILHLRGPSLINFPGKVNPQSHKDVKTDEWLPGVGGGEEIDYKHVQRSFTMVKMF